MNQQNGVLWAGVDIGGTKLHAVIATPNGTIRARGRKKTRAEEGFEAVMDRVAACLEEACQAGEVPLEKIKAVGLGVPAPTLPDGTVVQAPNLNWKNVSPVRALSKRLNRPVFAENDCNAGTLGEYMLGAGRGARTLAGLFMGTGLGGGLIYHGELIRGENCLAAEIGHMVVKVGGRECGCGHKGCLEAYASKVGLGRRFEREIKERQRRSLLEDLTEGDYRNVRSGLLAKAWAEKDEVAREALEEAAFYLGVGVGNLITLLGPDAVVLGGGVFEALGKELLGAVRKGAEESAFPPASLKDTRLLLSALGDDAVALGALVFARESLDKKR